MRTASLAWALGAMAAAAAADPVGPTLPWGVHLAFGSDPHTSMTVMWSTRSDVESSIVSFSSSDGAPQHVSGEQWVFSDVGNTQTLHRVRLTGLTPGATYSYTVGDGANATSAAFHFSMPPLAGWSPTIAVYGDMGISSNALATMPLLVQDVEDGLLDVTVHIGDAAYDLQSNNGATGDAFMVQIEAIAALKPYLICPGNHEDAKDFVQYRNRIGCAMPAAASPSGGGNGTFSSFDLGLVHFVLVSSEVYMSVQAHSAGLAIEQAEWLERDLAAVDRSVTPWVALGLHQPFYCSANDDHDDCHQLVSLVRVGLEKIIYNGGVDIVFGAHEHAYERNYPVFDLQWNASRTGPGAYVDAAAPVHILTGAAGCPENQDGWQRAGNAWSAVRINDYGYGRLKAVNSSALEWVYIDNKAGKVLDSVTLIKTSADGKPAFPPRA